VVEESIDRVGRIMAFVTVEVINRAGKIATKVNGTMVMDGSSRFVPADVRCAASS
jgi:hypothetical protein